LLMPHCTAVANATLYCMPWDENPAHAGDLRPTPVPLLRASATAQAAAGEQGTAARMQEGDRDSDQNGAAAAGGSLVVASFLAETQADVASCDAPADDMWEGGDGAAFSEDGDFAGGDDSDVGGGGRSMPRSQEDKGMMPASSDAPGLLGLGGGEVRSSMSPFVHPPTLFYCSPGCVISLTLTHSLSLTHSHSLTHSLTCTHSNTYSLAKESCWMQMHCSSSWAVVMVRSAAALLLLARAGLVAHTGATAAQPQLLRAWLEQQLVAAAAEVVVVAHFLPSAVLLVRGEGVETSTVTD
jgi:hypothetical protein